MKKILHLTFHYGTANDLNYIFNKLGYEITLLLTTDLPYTISEQLAQQLWEENKEYFQSFDIIITSDTAGLSYPFLLHLNELKPKLIIWICNRFNISMENEYGFLQLFKAAVQHPKVSIIPYTQYEVIWCKNFGIQLNNDVIHCLGRHEVPYISEPNVMARCFRPIDTSFRFRDVKDSVFVQDYHNNHKLYDFLKSQNVSVSFGKYMDINEIKDYKAVVSFPDAFSKIFQMEAIQHGIILLLPSLKCLKQLIKDPYYTFTSKQYITEDLLNICEYFNYPDCFVFFDSIDELPQIIERIDVAKIKKILKDTREIIHDDILEKWVTVLEK